MKTAFTLILVCTMILATPSLAQNSIAIKGSVQPHAPISIVGQKSMIAGTENGIVEAWVFPYQICHGFQLSYQNNEAAIPIPLAGLAQNIEVRPEATTITFSHPLFTIRETIFAPIDWPALVALIEVDSYQDLTLIASFFPDMEPMWPAGLGGQYAFGEDKSKAYVISESRRLRNAFIGTPNARALLTPLAHELVQAPSQFAFDCKRNNGRTQKFSIVIAANFAKRDSARVLYEKQIYNFSITQQGNANPEVTAWDAFPMTFRQLDETHTQIMLERLASVEISTDWGCRMLSNKSSAYEPLAYNNGAVWPFLSGYNLWAMFNYNRTTAGLQMLRNMAEWTFVDARGYLPEVVSGEYFRPLDTSVPHQLFSSFGYAIGLIRGLLGLEPRSPVGQLAGLPVLRFAPNFPPN